MGMQMQMVTRGWLIYEITQSPVALALVVVSFGIPMTMLSLVGGALADRLPKRTVISIAQGINAVSGFVIALLVFSNVVELWHLLVSGVVNGVLIAMSMPSRQAIIPALVPRDQVVNAVGLSTGGMNASRIIGPAIAGILIPFVGVAGVFILIGLLNALAALVLLRVSNTGKVEVDVSTWKMKREVLKGLTYVLKAPALRALILLSFIAVLLGMPFQNLLPAFVVEALNAGSEGLGILMAISGLGAVIGSLVVASMGSVKRKGIVLLLSVLGWALFVIVFAFSTTFLVASVAILLIGVTSSIFMSLNMSVLQLLSEPQMHGRVMSVSMMTFGLMPLGLLPISFAAEIIGTPLALGIAGIPLVVIAAGFLVLNRTVRNVSV